MSCQLIPIISPIGSRIQKISPPVIIALLVGILFIFSLIAGCTSQGNTEPGDENHTLVVACTIPPQEEFIKSIGGNKTRVLVMVPAGASPHTFEPVPSQIARLESADLYVSVGSGIEFENRWLDRIKTMYPDLPIANSSENISLMQGEEEQHETSPEETAGKKTASDPHVWLSVRNAVEMVGTTCRALTDLRPENKVLYEKNRDIYITRLNALDRKINKALAGLPSKKILVYHPAFGYFCRDYGLTQISVEENGKEPSAKGLASVIDQAIHDNISFIFIEPEVSSRTAQTLASEVNASVVLISPLSGKYIDNMQTIADRIAGIT